ncbi:hypothetical protein P9112_007826 [Eukaryota sp. TZLM1-RC]
MSVVLSYCSNEDNSAFGIVRSGSLTAYEFKAPGQVSLKARIGASNIRFAAISGSPLTFIAIARDAENLLDNMYIEVLEIKGNHPVSLGTISVAKAPVTGIRMIGQFLLVINQTSIIAHSLSNLKQYCTINTFPSTFPVCAVDYNMGVRIAYADPQKTGLVSIMELKSKEIIGTFKAHNHSIVSIVFGPDGDMIATASSRGTLVRVFEVSRLFEVGPPTVPPCCSFRRGHVPSSISALLLQPPFLCVTSDRETIHFFQLTQKDENAQVDTDNQAASLYSISEGSRFPFYIRIPSSPCFSARYIALRSYDRDIGNEMDYQVRHEFWICDHTATAHSFSVPDRGFHKTQEVLQLSEGSTICL